MIKVIAKSVIKEGQIENYLKEVDVLITETRKEEGCISYELFQDINSENIFFLIEEWESKEDLEKHKLTDHIINIIPKINEHRISSEVSVLEKLV